MEQEQKVYSISEYLDLVNNGLKQFSVKIMGEVGKIGFGSTGHVYFSLRDEQDKSVMDCIIWAGKYKLYGINLQEGMKIIALGTPGIYKQTGRFSFVAESIELAGEGQLKKEYEKLKEKLQAEGVFDLANKRPLPMYPQRIGVITSKQGAVIGDFLSNIGKFGFKIFMIDSRVEGQLAIFDLLGAITTFRKKEIDVLVLMRGGGSFESLQAFNNEIIVREIAGFPVPVIAAIGHDRDVPLVCLAADLMVSTPSIAAIKVGESWQNLVLHLERSERKVFDGYKEILRQSGEILQNSIEGVREFSAKVLKIYKLVENNFKVSLQVFANNIANTKTDINSSLKGLIGNFKKVIINADSDLKVIEDKILANNPHRQLKLGYAIARKNGRVIKSVKDVSVGDSMEVSVFDGIINANVKNLN